jgi:hypothetical protein
MEVMGNPAVEQGGKGSVVVEMSKNVQRLEVHPIQQEDEGDLSDHQG